MGFTFLAQTTGLAPSTDTPPVTPPAAPPSTPPATPTPPATGPGGAAPTASVPGSATTAPAGKPAGPFDMILSVLPIILMVVAVYFFMFRNQRKEEKTRKTQIEAMKKGDEVLLISGKYGKVVDIRDDYVIVKVDEANNVKEKYVKSAIQRVIGDTDTKKA